MLIFKIFMGLAAFHVDRLMMEELRDKEPSIYRRVVTGIEKTKKRIYFPRKIWEPEDFKKQVNDRLRDYKKALELCNIDGSSPDSSAGYWAHAEKKALNYARGLSYDLGRNEFWDSVWRVAYWEVFDVVWERAKVAIWGKRWGRFMDSLSNNARNVAGSVARDFANCAAREVVSDYEHSGNSPPEKYFRFYDIGWPRGFRVLDGKEVLLLDVNRRTGELGCFAENEPDILYKHGWSECDRRKRIK